MRVIPRTMIRFSNARLQHEEDDQRQQQRRDRVQDVGEPQQDVVGPAAEIAGDEADRRSRASPRCRPRRRRSSRDVCAPMISCRRIGRPRLSAPKMKPRPCRFGRAEGSADARFWWFACSAKKLGPTSATTTTKSSQQTAMIASGDARNICQPADARNRALRPAARRLRHGGQRVVLLKQSRTRGSTAT